MYSNPDVKIFLVGNKSDLDNERKVFKHEINLLMEEYQIEYYIETSAKSGLNTQKLFCDIGKILFNSFEIYKESSLSFCSKNYSSVKIHNRQEKMENVEIENLNKPDSKGCC